MGNVKPVKMGKTKVWVARDAFELYEILGLTPQDAVEMMFRSQLNDKIIEAVKAGKLTHEKVAKLAGTSRTKITAILNGNTSGVSSDLLLRILYSLGYQTKVTFTPIRAKQINRKAELAA
ncbi:MAG: XRE family transcriptional regulator [Acidobacteria bacterium]|nr:XRE family transcriptional regulator [Acidobacteriota bacterium]